MIKRKVQDERFSDGLAKIYRKENVSKPGDMPIEKLVHIITLRYRQKTVGAQRFYDAKKNQEQIDNVIRTLFNKNVCVLDIAKLEDGRKYKIRQVQYPETEGVKVMDLALERIEEGDEDEV